MRLESYTHTSSNVFIVISVSLNTNSWETGKWIELYTRFNKAYRYSRFVGGFTRHFYYYFIIVLLLYFGIYAFFFCTGKKWFVFKFLYENPLEKQFRMVDFLLSTLNVSKHIFRYPVYGSYKTCINKNLCFV